MYQQKTKLRYRQVHQVSTRKRLGKDSFVSSVYLVTKIKALQVAFVVKVTLAFLLKEVQPVVEARYLAVPHFPNKDMLKPRRRGMPASSLVRLEPDELESVT